MSEEIEITKLDNVKTAKNVRNFFQTVFPDYLIEAGYHRTDLKTSQINQTGIASHNGNSAEQKMKHIYNMQNKCKAVYQAIDSLPNKPKQPFKAILSEVYLDELEDWKVMQKVGYAKTNYGRLKQQALCQFAKALEVQKIKYDADIPNLEVIKDD
ncbi:DUF1492 domain-containing protein [Lactobacillus sp. ESL0679]|uniref:ArpU family phage packaging/lysis transcriptional regulator n=1 Tax=Lactobacillus sp. ESL0679 TaxID=2983209 RepID=UPI0023F833F3|nr:ArpU family phage packaging/lysis transcriptional regulator [Lactobacillus sp. ESL0679]MDF7683389.1 DUF1492 domain-containing protein [Lactobacillus sp. ESL0679]